MKNMEYIQTMRELTTNNLTTQEITNIINAHIRCSDCEECYIKDNFGGDCEDIFEEAVKDAAMICNKVTFCFKCKLWNKQTEVCLRTKAHCEFCDFCSMGKTK